MRDLPETLDKIIPLIPPGDAALIAKLESIKQSALFAAPEIQTAWWKRCENILNFIMPPIDADWKVQVMETFNGNQDDL